MKTTAPRLFGAATILYAAIGLWLAVDVQYLQGDALSRVSATRSVLFSRDPHLAAIGFVFTPLTALVQLPVVALSDWWPQITRWGLSGVLMSAPFMAGAVVQIHGIAADRGCPAWLRWTVTATFALHPMILYYGANGMSEAPFLMMLCWALRRLIRWFTTDDVHDLVFAGLALALAYLARYDALAATAAATMSSTFAHSSADTFGPICESSSSGSPTRRPRTFSTSRATNSSNTDRCTYVRSLQVHT